MFFSKLFIILILVPCGFSKKGEEEYYSRPKIFTQNGHLYVSVPDGKKIYFESTKMNMANSNIDLLTTLTKADNATKLLSIYQNSFSSYITRIADLEFRLQSLEHDLRYTINMGTRMNGSSLTNVNNAVSIINRKITGVQRGLRRLNDLILANECSSNPCKNGGKCTDIFNGFLCTCQSGWEGITCETDVNECSRFSGTDLGCQNGATCVNRLGTYECLCQEGWFGLHCTRRTADCNTAGTELCGHGTCVTQHSDAGYKCLCDQGWTTDSTNLACNRDVDECKMNRPPCSTNPVVPCVNVPGSFYCGNCPQGFTGNGYYCTDKDECAMFNGGCSVAPRVQCINTLGSRICGQCPPGYYGDGITCSFRGVCNINNGGCHPSAQCRDNPRISSTFVQCICPTGMTGSGFGPNGCTTRSISAHPCNPNPCRNGGNCTANYSTGDYKCNCKPKYVGRNCGSYFDACEPNPCWYGGTCIVMTGISYRCECRPGFTGRRCQQQRLACGGTINNSSGTLMFPNENFQQQTSGGFTCVWTLETNENNVLNVTIKKFKAGNSSPCEDKWLQLYDGRNSAATPLGTFCGTQLPLGGNFKTTGNALYIWFKSDSTSELELKWTSEQPGCGGVINGTSDGTIHSPGFPGNYPNNRDCRWTLIAPFGKRFLFHFYELSIGNSSDCSHDFLKFYNVPYRHPAVDPFIIFCNSSVLPSQMYSQGFQVMIYFHSDNADNYRGFQITYRVVEAIPGCGGVYTSKSGILQSVNYDNENPVTDYQCEYQIKLPERSKVKLTFLEMKLGNVQSCNRNFVKIYEGFSDDSLIGTYCGNTLPGPYVSLTNQITIVSTLAVNSKWRIQYETICHFKYTATKGSFNSVGSKGDCIYQIDQPLGYQIVLTLKLSFTRVLFRSGVGVSCIDDYIQVRDGNSEAYPLLGKYCGNKTVSLTSSLNSLWIKVRNVFFLGFEADYTGVDVGCGGILTEKVGTIDFPTGKSQPYPSNKKCRWLIMAPPGNVIQLTWMTFNVEQGVGCSFDNVQIYDNTTEAMGIFMGKYCGYGLPPTLLSSSNIVTVFFESDNSLNDAGFLIAYTFMRETNVCGGNYFTSSGVIKSPGYPNHYPINRECKWTISVDPGTQILLNITEFNLEPYPTCRFDWLEIRNGGTSASPLIGRYCGTDIPKLIPAHTNKVYLFFNSDLSSTAPGFKITWTSTSTGCGGKLTSPSGSIISPYYPEPYNRNADCLWTIVVSIGSRVQVIFVDIDLERHTVCSLDYVELLDGATKNSKSLGKYCAPFNEHIKSTGNKMLVRFKSDISFQGRGFQIQYSTLCRNKLKGFRGVIESPNFPNKYPTDQDCEWDIVVPKGNKINVTFSDFQLDRVTVLHNISNCTTDFVEIRNKSKYEETFETYGRFCGTENPGVISLNSDEIRIRFVSVSDFMGIGFRLEWQLFGCGGILRNNEGTIHSPNYPKSYPPDVQCNWLIQVDYGSSVNITFNHIEIEVRQRCDFDQIQVFNGPDETYNLLGTFCHQTKPISVTTNGNNMFVTFTADSSNQGQGFIANYSTVPTKCGGKVSVPEGSIFSPNYPKNYNKNDTCDWLIETDENHVITLEFVDVELPRTEDCRADYVKIFDGPSPAYPVVITVCGINETNTTFTSSTNQVYVEFRTYSLRVSKGFHLKYKKACGARIKTDGSGIIELSRNYGMDTYSDCTWTIEATNPTDHVALTISHMNSEMDCDFIASKIVKVFNGVFSDSPLLGEYCGTKLPPTLFSDGSAMHITVQMPSDFLATYTVVDSQCGGDLVSLDGFFSSPGYPKTYPLSQQCEWTISIGPGNHLNLNFITFDLPASERCNTDYLEIRQNNVSGKLLGVYCGQAKPENITNIGSLWMMFKSSNLTTSAKGVYAEYALSNSIALEGSSGQVSSPLYPRKVFTSSDYTWTITVKSGKAVLVTFKDFQMPSGIFSLQGECYSSINVYDGPDATYVTLGTFCGSDLPPPVKSKSNVITIVGGNIYRWNTEFKFLLEWNEVDRDITTPADVKPTGCGSNETIDISSLKTFNITSPGYPNGYAHNLKCEWIFSTVEMNHLRLEIKHMDLKSEILRVKECYSDYVELFKKEAGRDWESAGKLCNDVDAKTIELPSLGKIVFTSGAYLNGSGFSAEIKEVCGGNLLEPSGYIILDNKTDIKGDGCQWNITVRSGRKIELFFEKLALSNDGTHSGCDNYLIIRNGMFPDSPLLGNGKYCGTENKLDTLKSASNHLYIKYFGSSMIEGFQLKYQEVSNKCGEEIQLEFFDNSTEISSPNYPNIPEPYTECVWIIRAPAGDSLQIDFEEKFDFTVSYTCEKEYVEIRDGGTQSSPLIGRFCKTVPSTQITTDNIMFVKFFTDIPMPSHGFKAKISIATCGGTIRGRAGQIHSHDINIVGNNINCSWYLVGPRFHYLRMTFTELDIGSELNCSFAINTVTLTNVIEMPTNRSNEIGTYCGGQKPTEMKSLSNKVMVNLVVTNKLYYKGFILKYTASREGCSGNYNQESGIITVATDTSGECSWSIEVPEGRRITLEFEDLDRGNVANKRQYVYVFNGPRYISWIGSAKRSDLFNSSKWKVFKSSSNKAWVYLVSWNAEEFINAGLKIKFSSNEPTICVGDMNAASGVLTEPKSQSRFYLCEWKHISSQNQTFSVTVRNVSSNTPDENSRCGDKFIGLSLKNQKKETIREFCRAGNKSVTGRSAFPITIIKALTRDYNLNFTASYNTHDCGGIVRSETGFISSPNFPHKPTKSFECAWLLTLPSEQQIKINVIHSNLEYDCENSFLEIYNGGLPSSPRIGKYCQNKTLGSFISQTNKLWIEYKYNATSNNSTGFNLTYEPVIQGCGGTFHDKNRIIQTPGYGKEYPNNIECPWEIRSSPGYFIMLKFIDRFHIEETADCVSDFVEIWDWKNNQWVSLGKKCGRTAPHHINSTSDRLRLLFRSNDKVTATGFKAQWDWHCGGTLTATSKPRYIVSPGYPEYLEKNLHCVYDIAPEQSVVTIIFEDFDLGDVWRCKSGNLTIYPSMLSVYMPSHYKTKTYCGSNSPSPLRARGKQRIDFTTGKYKWKNRGFKFQYSSENCGGEVNTSSTIESYGIDQRVLRGLYNEYVHCDWKISAPTDKIVVLVIEYLKMEQTDDCFTQSLTMYNGPAYNYTAQLAQLCGNIDEPYSYTSTSNQMYLTLSANPASYKGFKAFVYFTYGPSKACGGMVNLTETKSLESPNNLEDLDCAWKIVAPLDYRIQIQFTSFDFPLNCSGHFRKTSRDICRCAFVEIRDGGSPGSEQITKICTNNNNRATFTTSTHRGYIRMVVPGRHNNVFKATLTLVKSVCGTSQLTVNTTTQILTSPNYPNRSPSNTICIWNLEGLSYADTIYIHFKAFHLRNTSLNNGTSRCYEDVLEITEDPNLHFITEGLGPYAKYNGNSHRAVSYSNGGYNRQAFCGNSDLPFDYYSKSKSLMLSYKSITGQSQGFMLEYKLEGCNRNYTELQGRIKYKQQIETEKDCYIHITVPQNYTISLFFIEFNIAYDADCKKHGLEIKENNATGTQLLKACDSSLHDPVFSRTNRLWVHFYTYSDMGRYIRYDFVYTASDRGRGCGGPFYNFQGTFTSPLYPNTYSEVAECIWDIRVPAGSKVALKFTSFSIVGDCIQNNVLVETYIGASVSSHRFCTDDQPAVLFSDSHMKVTYHSSRTNTGIGWIAKYLAVKKESDVITW